MNDFYTSADPAGLHPKGWYPGKKHGVGKRALQVATMGIYNPDDRFASDVNKRKIVARAGAEEKVNAGRMAQAAELDAITQNLLKYTPGLDPAEAARQAAGYFATQAKAATAANEAEAANSAVVQAERTGALPGSTEFGAARTAAGTEMSRAAGANATNQRRRAQGAAPMQEELGGLDTGVEASRLLGDRQQNRNRNTFEQALQLNNIPEMQALLQRGQIDLGQLTKADTARKMGQNRALEDATNPANSRAAADSAEAAAALAAAQRRMTSDATTADRIAEATANRNLGLTLPPLTSMLLPFGAPTNRVDGATAPRQVAPTETVERDADGNIVKRVTRQAPGTTPAPAAAPSARTLTAEEFQKLLE